MTDTISHASEADAPAIADLVNRSYRPTSDEAGWTHEAALVAGQRTSADQVRALFHDGSVVLTMARNQALIACVHVLKEGEACWIGMLATEPKLQGHGVGKTMLEAAELLAMQTFQAHGRHTALPRRCWRRFAHAIRPRGQVDGQTPDTLPCLTCGLAN